MKIEECNWPKYNLSQAEWEELVAIEYVLTHGYTDNVDRDTKRHKVLSDKKQNYIDSLTK